MQNANTGNRTVERDLSITERDRKKQIKRLYPFQDSRICEARNQQYRHIRTVTTQFLLGKGICEGDDITSTCADQLDVGSNPT